MLSFQNLITKICEKAKLVAVFGSHISQNYDCYSDIDVLILYEWDHSLKSIQDQLLRLNNRINQQIHLNAYQINDFRKRLSYHDYKLMSMLDDAVVFKCEDDHLQSPVHRKRVNAASIEYNENMGIKYLTTALQNLEASRFYITHPTLHHQYQMKSIQSLCVRNSHLALGYLLASRKMKTTGHDTVLSELLSGESSLLNTLLWADKRIKRSMKTNLNITTECVLRVQSEFIRSGLHHSV